MILAIDTATRWLGVALHDGTAVVAESGWRCLNNHTTELAEAIQALMAHAQIETSDLTGIAITIGPGSYTGLRVGLAMAKGLAMVQKIPLLAVSTLDVVAFQVPRFNGRLLTIAEAGRTRVCVAEYQWHETYGWQLSVDPDIKTWNTILEETEGSTLFAGEIGEKTAVKVREADSRFVVASGGTAVRRAGNLAEIGWQRLKSGEVADTASIAPVYLRNPAGT